MHYSNTHWNYESNFEEEQGRWAKIQNSLLDSIIKKMKAETLQKTDPERPLSPQWQHSLELLNSSLISVFLGKKMIAKSCHIYSFSFCWLTLGQFRIFFFPQTSPLVLARQRSQQCPSPREVSLPILRDRGHRLASTHQCIFLWLLTTLQHHTKHLLRGKKKKNSTIATVAQARLLSCSQLFAHK